MPFLHQCLHFGIGRQISAVLVYKLFLRLGYYQCMGDKASYSVHTVIVLAPTALDLSLYLAIRARPCLRFHN